MDALSKADIKLLKQHGISTETIINTPADQAYKFGIMAAALKDKRTKTLTYNDFKKFIASGNYVPLTQAEQESLKFVKQQMYNDIKGLGNRISQDFRQTIIEASKIRRAKTVATIKREAIKVMSNRGGVNDLASVLGHKTKDWARDFDRISDYVMHSAYQHGVAAQLAKEFGDDVEVFFHVYPGACKHCIETYLTDGIGSEPKIFKLNDVVANGSNIGRKAKDYLPSIDPLHPFCRCRMDRKPENGLWDKTKKQFVIGRNTYGVKRKSKIKVTIS